MTLFIRICGEIFQAQRMSFTKCVELIRWAWGDALELIYGRPRNYGILVRGVRLVHSRNAFATCGAFIRNNSIIVR